MRPPLSTTKLRSRCCRAGYEMPARQRELLLYAAIGRNPQITEVWCLRRPGIGTTHCRVDVRRSTTVIAQPTTFGSRAGRSARNDYDRGSLGGSNAHSSEHTAKDADLTMYHQ